MQVVAYSREFWKVFAGVRSPFSFLSEAILFTALDPKNVDLSIPNPKSIFLWKELEKKTEYSIPVLGTMHITSTVR